MIKIITIFDKNEEFIEYQYNSLKHIKCDYEYLIFNNGSTIEQRDKIDSLCKRLNIKTIILNSGMEFTKNYGSEITYNKPSIIAGTALNEAFSNLTGRIFKIDSDMFFIKDIDLSKITEDLLFIPNGINNNIIWSGIFGINLDSVTDNLNFLPTHGDTFSESCQLINNEKYSKKEFNLITFFNQKDGVYNVNVNTDCVVSLNKEFIITSEKVNLNVDHKWIYERCGLINELLLSNNFPCKGVTNHNNNYDIDIIYMDDLDFMIHFKSSNWARSDQYHIDKKKALLDYLNSNK